MKASGGVRVFGILFIVLNILGMFCVLIAPTGGISAQRDVLLALLIFLIGLLTSVGLLRLQAWARMVTLIVTATILGWFLSLIIVFRDFWSIPFICWSGFVLWYFLRPSVKAQFQVAR